ncbi:uncharacterized protein ISCGN_008270 [Ixodes scapularis]
MWMSLSSQRHNSWLPKLPGTDELKSDLQQNRGLPCPPLQLMAAVMTHSHHHRIMAGHDETDGDVGILPVLNRKCLDPLSLLRHLEKDASSVVHFTEEQLELVSEVPKESLDPRMFNLSFVETVRDTCGRLLVERREAQEAIDLIKILARSSQEAFSDAKPGNTRADSEQTGETSGEDDKDRISGHDETDGDVGILPVLNRKCLDPLSLLRHLEKDASSVVHFTEEQLELVSEVPKESLDPRMFNLSFVETVRDTCGRLLVERREAQEAIDLIKILARSSQEAFSDAKPGNTRADSEQTGETSGEDDKDRISGRPTKKPKTG